jgi:hypothetical protein
VDVLGNRATTGTSPQEPTTLVPTDGRFADSRRATWIAPVVARKRVGLGEDTVFLELVQWAYDAVFSRVPVLFTICDLSVSAAFV